MLKITSFLQTIFKHSHCADSQREDALNLIVSYDVTKSQHQLNVEANALAEELDSYKCTIFGP